jgi:hypothetical protein
MKSFSCEFYEELKNQDNILKYLLRYNNIISEFQKVVIHLEEENIDNIDEIDTYEELTNEKSKEINKINSKINNVFLKLIYSALKNLEYLKKELDKKNIE